MSMFHYRAEVLDVAGGKARYRYFPDWVMAKAVHGEFEVDLKTGDYAIVTVQPPA